MGTANRYWRVFGFKRLWEIVMIRLTSEAICETIGSMMGSHGINKILQPKYFNMETVLRFNLGLLHFLDSLIEEIFDRALIKTMWAQALEFSNH